MHGVGLAGSIAASEVGVNFLNEIVDVLVFAGASESRGGLPHALGGAHGPESYHNPPRT